MTMRVHYLDVLILLLALLGVVTVSIIEFSSSDSKPSSKPKEDTVTCTAPAHFSASWVKYSNQYCAAALKSGDIWPMIEDSIPPSMNRHKKNLTGFLEEDSDSELIEEEGSKFPNLLLTETIVAVLTFVVLQMIITMLFSRTLSYGSEDQDISPESGEGLKGPIDPKPKSQVVKQLSGTSTVTIFYCLVLFGAVGIWFVLAGMSHVVMKERSDGGLAVSDEKPQNDTSDHPKIFICDMPLRILGNIQRYSFQCIVNGKTAEEVNDSNTPKVNASKINTAMCFTIACLLLIHLLYTLVVSALVNKNPAGGKGSFISDFNLAVSVGAV